MIELDKKQRGAKSHKANAFFIDTISFNAFQKLQNVNAELDKNILSLKKENKLINEYALSLLVEKFTTRFSREIEDCTNLRAYIDAKFKRTKKFFMFNGGIFLFHMASFTKFFMN